MRAASFQRANRNGFDALPPEYSHLYLAVGGQLAAVICISDPAAEEAKEVLSALRALGSPIYVIAHRRHSYRTAAAIAAQVGVDDFRAGVPSGGQGGVCGPAPRGRGILS